VGLELAAAARPSERPVQLSLARRAASSIQRRIHGFGALGAGSIVRPPYTIVSARSIHIGERTTIGPNALLSVVTHHLGRRYEPVLRIGDDCSIGQNFVVGCIDAVTIGSKVLISSNVFVGDCIHGYADPDAPVIDQPLQKRGAVVIEDGVFLGINTVILPGVRIGRNSVVGAGSVVTADVAARTVVAGNPARVIRAYDVATGTWTRPGETLREVTVAA
jgi:acetyltransferase-like isoleucine patch superfamily enzyme